MKLLTCVRCGIRPTLRSSKPRICRGCAKKSGICIYCGGPTPEPSHPGEARATVCRNCDPGAGHIDCGRYRRKISDLQYYGKDPDWEGTP